MKATADKVITTVVTLVLGILALVVIWLFLSGSMPTITKAIEKFTCGMCKSVAGPFQGICGEC